MVVASRPAPFVERDARLKLADGSWLAYSIVDARDPSARPAVVLLHGLASNRSRWAEFVERTSLTKHFDVLRLDLRGHGDSAAGGRLTLERWCDDLVAVLDSRGIARAIPVGHSLGAQVALAFAARHPDRCAAMVLIDPVFRLALCGQWRRIASLGPLFAAAAWLVRAANRAGVRRRHVIPYDLRALDGLARQALASKQAEEAFIRQYSSVRADLRQVRTASYLQDLVEMIRPIPPLPSLRLPVLALLSHGGTFADPAEMARHLEALPRHQMAWIECHHWPLTERPVEVRTAIERWCESLD